MTTHVKVENQVCPIISGQGGVIMCLGCDCAAWCYSICHDGSPDACDGTCSLMRNAKIMRSVKLEDGEG